MTPTGIEPVLPPWKGDVLTAWPRGHYTVTVSTVTVVYITTAKSELQALFLLNVKRLEWKTEFHFYAEFSLTLFFYILYHS